MRPCVILRSPTIEPTGGLPVDEFVTISRAELDELRAKAEGVPSSKINPNGSSSGWEDYTEERDAREATSLIIRDLGFAPVYAGGAHAALLTETGGPLQMREVDVKDATDVLAEALTTFH